MMRSALGGLAAKDRLFPPGFLFGASTSAFQIEGCLDCDGRAPSIWDRFCAEEGRVQGDDRPEPACEHYRRLAEDRDLLVALGANAYRFSISWPRLFPEGPKTINVAGRDHYDREIDGLLECGIEPIVTLYHFELPAALSDQGGWPARDTAERFGDFAAACFAAYGDRVRIWVSINEPWITAVLGYELGVHAPGVCDLGASVRAAHHLLLAHGRAAAALSASGHPGRIGVAHSLFPHEPASEHPDDVAAARLSDGYVNRWYLDPLQHGRYPKDVAAIYERHGGPLEFVRDGDLEAIAARSDFIGVNYYTRRRVAFVADKSPWPFSVLPPQEGIARTDADWEIVPHCFSDLLIRLWQDYRAPLLVTENGGVFNESVGPDGTVADLRRVAFLHDHLAALLAARSAGAEVVGYCHWSLLDNFEWALGYAPRFGLVHVDYATQRRTIKASGYYFAELAAARRLLGPPAALAT